MSAGKFIAGFIIGGVVGAVAGVLLAPRSGEETREITEDYLMENCNYVGAGECLPLSIDEDVVNLIATEEVTSDSGERILFVRNKNDYSFQVSEEFENYTLPLIYYKGYSAKVLCDDGSETELPVTQSENALVQVSNDTGSSGKIYVKYEGTTIQKVSSAITLGTIMIIAGYIITQKAIKKSRK